MSKISDKVCLAFLNKQPKIYSRSNTISSGNALLLFGNKIAEWKNEELYISNGGYISKKGVVCSVTTLERLKAIGAKIQQRKKIVYLNNHPWQGEWLKINDIPQQQIIKENKSLF